MEGFYRVFPSASRHRSSPLAKSNACLIQNQEEKENTRGILTLGIFAHCDIWVRSSMQLFNLTYKLFAFTPTQRSSNCSIQVYEHAYSDLSFSYSVLHYTSCQHVSSN